MDGAGTPVSDVPIPLVGIPPTESIQSIALGKEHSCVLTYGLREVYCWGGNGWGELGDGNAPTESAAPVKVSGLSGVTQISASVRHTCALLDTGRLKCWGDNQFGQLGNGSFTSSDIPVSVIGPLAAGERVSSVSAGYEQTCAVTEGGKAYCWGGNENGELGLGDGSGIRWDYPQQLPGLTGVTSISSGYGVTCAVVATKAKCRGYGGWGQLGDGTTTWRTSPVDVSSISGLTSVHSISVGRHVTCAVSTLGSAWCWGTNDRGQVGNGTNNDVRVPVPVAGLYAGIDGVAAGEDFACAWGVKTAAGRRGVGAPARGSAAALLVTATFRSRSSRTDPAVGALDRIEGVLRPRTRRAGCYRDLSGVRLSRPRVDGRGCTREQPSWPGRAR